MNRKQYLQIIIVILPVFGVLFSLQAQTTFTTINREKYLTQQNKDNNLSNGMYPSYDAQNLIGLSPDVWDNNLTGQGITVAVLDTGISPNHVVFTDDGHINWSERILAFYDGSTQQLSSNPNDIQWHGTWAASILGGNSSMFQGITPDVQFIIMQLFQEIDGEIVTTLSILEGAVEWLLSNKDLYNIKIVSMSFGVKPTYENLPYVNQVNDVAEKLVEENILVVAAAGNNGLEGIRTINSPAAASKVLAVGGVDFNGNMYSKSSQGPTYDGLTKPDVCAPAVSILGAYPNPSNDVFAYASGTSASTPFVAGLAALMLEKDDTLKALDLKNIISLSSYRTINPLSIYDNLQGWGVIQGYAALESLQLPINLNSNIQFNVQLNQNYSVFCQPITLSPNHYYFELIEKDALSGELYLFDTIPTEDGTPNLLSHTINPIDPLKRMGFYTDYPRECILVLKSHLQANGDFTIKMVIEFRNFILVGLALVNFICLVYGIHLYKSIKYSRN